MRMPRTIGRPPSTNLPKKERDERRHAKAGGGVATALAGTQTFSAQRVPVWQRAAAQGAAAAAGPRRHAAPRLQSGTDSFGRCVDPEDALLLWISYLHYCCCFETEEVSCNRRRYIEVCA